MDIYFSDQWYWSALSMQSRYLMLPDPGATRYHVPAQLIASASVVANAHKDNFKYAAQKYFWTTQ